MVNTPKALLPAWYKQYNLLPDGGQSDSSVKVEMTAKIHLYIPNFDARRKAVLKHDVHHLVTGYPSTLKGEAEIAAWEIGSGCANYWAALVINSQGMLMGLIMFPLATYKAYLKGQRTTNLYKDRFSEAEFLNMEIEDLQKALKLADYQEGKRAGFREIISFLGASLFCVFIAVLSLVLLPFLILYNIKQIFFTKKEKQQVTG